jgi:hypothetical protein
LLVCLLQQPDNDQYHSSLERSYTDYTRVPSPNYRCMINLVVSLFNGMTFLQSVSCLDTFGPSLFLKFKNLHSPGAENFKKKTYTQVSTNHYCPTLNLVACHSPYIYLCFGLSDESRKVADVSLLFYTNPQQKPQLKAQSLSSNVEKQTLHNLLLQITATY